MLLRPLAPTRRQFLCGATAGPMAERGRSRWRPVRLCVLAGVLAALLCLGGGPAIASGQVRLRTAAKGPLPLPSSFQLEGSNGYKVTMVALPRGKGSAGSILIFVAGKNQGVSYRAPASVTETSIQADLGALGEVSVTFQRSGMPATARCRGQQVSFDSGRYEGKIEFHGEEGYTEVVATSVPGNIDFLLAELCGATFSSGSNGNPRARGATLSIRNPALGPDLSVSKRRLAQPRESSSRPRIQRRHFHR